MLGVQPLIQAGFDGSDLPTRIVVSHTQSTCRSVHFLPTREGQHPIGILLQFGQRIPTPDLANLIG